MLTEALPQTATCTVLLVDDNDEQRKHWSNGLRNSSFHYSVVEASSGESGLDLFHKQNIECVILDLDMPESGFHALFQLVPDRKCPQVAVIILTRLVHPNLFEMAKHNGAQACLVKQFISAEDLANEIQNAIAAVRSNNLLAE